MSKNLDVQIDFAIDDSASTLQVQEVLGANLQALLQALNLLAICGTLLPAKAAVL